MMTCNLAKDLMPLEIEGLLHDESSALLKEHLETCSACRQLYEEMSEDYIAQPIMAKESGDIHSLVQKLAKYQSNIKLAAVLAAMLLSCVITGAGVQFLSTFPLLIIVPFACRLYYQGSLWILLSTLPFAMLGGWISENNGSYIPFFMVIAFVLACVGVGAAVLLKQALSSRRSVSRYGLGLVSIALLLFSCNGYFSLMGNPIGYVKAMIETRQYVDRTYPEGTLRFKGVYYNFKFNKHFGSFEYILDGVPRKASIEVYPDGDVSDSYKDTLEWQFADERSADLKAAIAAALQYKPFYVSAVVDEEEKLHISQDELNHHYEHLSYDPARKEQAALLRLSEGAKLHYVIALGGSSVDEFSAMSKEQLVSTAAAIAETLKSQQFSYKRIELKAKLDSSTVQSVSFTPDTSQEKLLEQVLTFDIDKKEGK